MVRVSSPAKLRPWSELTAKMVMGVVPGLVSKRKPSKAQNQPQKISTILSGRKKAHKHKLVALVNIQMALGQTAGCPRVNRAKKFMCSPRNTGNVSFSLWLTGGLSQGCPNFQKVYVFKVYVPFSCPILTETIRVHA